MAVVAFFGPMRMVASADDAPHANQAQEILAETGVCGGLVVHLGCGDGKLTAALRVSDAYLVHGLDADAGNVDEAREHVRSFGLCGRVTIDHLPGNRLPYVDGLVNLLVADDLGQVPMDEVMRVLAPRGVAHVKHDDAWHTVTKPWPEQLDEWTHCLHAADGNAVAGDAVVGPPRHVQWVGIPSHARQHERLASISAVVSAAGRVFSIQDEGPTASVLLPPKWFLAARDAFSGVILWKRPLGAWEGHLKNFRNGPADLARRLVAVGDEVYVTLGYGEPLRALDAATGQTLRTYEGTDGTREILHHEGVLYLVIGDADAQRDAAAERRGLPAPAGNKRLLAIQADMGNVLWEKADATTLRLMATTLAVADGRVFFQNPEAVHCLEATTGKVLWQTARPVVTKRPTWSAPTLVVYDGVVLSGDRAAPGMAEKEPERVHPAGWVSAPVGELIAFSAEDGKRLWSCRCRENFNAAVDVLVADGLVWTGELIVANDPGITVGRDPHTGEIKRRRPVDQEFYEVGMAHHRCHRNRATNRFVVTARAGVEFLDLATGEGIANHWIRGTCQFGVVPCNGLLYVPPHSCACYTKAKLNGFYALAPGRPSASTPAPEDNRLERGPAYSQITNHKSQIINPTDWPMHRHDAARSGATDGSVPVELDRAWQTELGGRLSGVTVADGRVFVAAIDEHTIYVLNAADGEVAWHFETGGRIDSPPTIHDGFAMFGSADGWVYCVRAEDGALAWRFRAAPDDRRVVAYGQLESVWPAHGSVLVADGVALVAAGRSSYLDGGIFLYRLDPHTGKLLSRTCVDSRDPTTRRQPKGTVEGFDLPGGLPDILSSDGARVYMRHLAFKPGDMQPTDSVPHLFCPSGLLDDSAWHRSYWIYGTQFYTGYRDWFRAGREVPGGRPLAFDAANIYGFGYRPASYNWSTPIAYHLFATSKEPQVIDSPEKASRLPAWGQREIACRWSTSFPFQARALVLAGERLLVAGPPQMADEERAWETPDDPAVRAAGAKQAAALAGKHGGSLWTVSTADGRKLAERQLESPPVFDGMAVAAGRVYLSTMAGNVICLAGKAESSE